MKIRSFSRSLTLATVALTFCAALASIAAENPQEREQKYIDILKSDAPPQEKAITCKKLAIYGSREAVPVLAPLLADAELSSWARIALEVIPDPSADEALRSALPKVQGRLLIGVINSLGVRRDAKAVGGLADKLKDADLEVAAAAAEALGRIGGQPAAESLQPLLGSARAELRAAGATGCILCAERWLVEGKQRQAVPLYDKVRQAEVPKQKVLEATRGAILAREAAGVPLLVEQLRATDKGLFGIALRTARELPGREATEALVAELDRSHPDRQPMLLLALADRNDWAVLPKLLQVAQNGSKPMRLAAVGLLDRFRDVSSVGPLLAAAADPDAELARSAKTALGRLGGKEVETDLLARLPQSSGKTRQVLIDLARQRRIEGALAAVKPSVEDADPGVRRAAVEAVGALGTEQETADLARLLTKTPADDRDNLEKALQSICARNGAKCLPQVLPLARNSDAGIRKIAFRTLASVGGPEALSAIKDGIKDADASVQDEAVSTLANWPNNWPEDTGVAEPLLALAKNAAKPAHQVQGLRGYLQHIEETKTLDNEQKLARLNDLQPLMKSAEEKRLAIAVLSTIPTAGVLDRLAAFAEDPSVTEESYMALVRVATDKNLKGASADQRRKVLQTAAENSKIDGTRKKAQDALKSIK